MRPGPGLDAKLAALLLACLLGLLGVLATLSRLDDRAVLIPLPDPEPAEGWSMPHQPVSVPVPDASREGSWLAFTGPGQHGTSQLYVVSPDGSDPEVVHQDVPGGGTREWSGDGRSILLCTALDYLDGGPGNPCMTAPSVTPNLRTGPSLTYFDSRPRRSPDGRRLAFVRIHDAEPNRAALMTVDIVSGQSAVLVEFEANVQLGVDWSPDGRDLVYTAKPRRGGATDLWIAAVDGSGARQVTHLGDDRTASSPTYSPDGTRIAISLDTGGSAAIAVLNPETGELATLAKFEGMVPCDLDWGPVVGPR